MCPRLVKVYLYDGALKVDIVPLEAHSAILCYALWWEFEGEWTVEMVLLSLDASSSPLG